MNVLTRRLTTLVSLVAFTTLPAIAMAAEMNAFEKAEMAQLSPDLRKQVEARMTGGQTVRGILETDLLNKISLRIPSRKVTAIDFEKGVAVVETQGGELKAVNFDPATLQLKT